jgi:adenylate kinase family enzyme
MDYKDKYIKYKTKYLKLKNIDINNQIGGGKNIIIHISGFPGSGKTTLGEKIQKIFKNTIVYDTDGFIQHHTKEGKELLKLDNEKKSKEYKILWKETIENKINSFTSKYQNKIIVFVGSLDNFAPPNTIYNIKADYKFILDVPLNELMKRYYLRIYLMEQKSTKKQSDYYWKKLSEGVYNINGSEDIIKDYQKYNEWHKKNNYTFLDDKHIIDKIKDITNN